jgi:hypothetical protein
MLPDLNARRAGRTGRRAAREVDIYLNLCDSTANVNVYLDDFSIN